MAIEAIKITVGAGGVGKDANTPAKSGWRPAYPMRPRASLTTRGMPVLSEVEQLRRRCLREVICDEFNFSDTRHVSTDRFSYFNAHYV